MKPQTFKKTNKGKEIRVSKLSTARESIGELEHSCDLFILTFGQFSLIDALVAILEKTGPANVAISTWTAASAHLEKSKELMNDAQILDFKMIVDRSFESRQPEYVQHMRNLFGPSCIRAIRTHAKFMLIRNEKWNIVVRTSMNLNENPRLENIEISESLSFSDFFQSIVDSVFAEVNEGENRSRMLEMSDVQESFPFLEVQAGTINQLKTNEAKTTHIIRKKS